MPPRDRHKPYVPPDCPREYHDDYIGRPARRSPGLRWVIIGAVALAAAVGLYLLL